MDFLSLRDLEYNRRGYPLFQKLNLSLNPGIIGLTGANGAGKSTLLKILSGICQPTGGQVLLEQQDIYHHAFLVKSQIGFVPAYAFLYAHLTVRENLAFIAKLKKIDPLKINLALDQCSLFNVQRTLFGKLSDGLKKRVAIASQLMHQPKLFILDEPEATLDPQQREQLWILFQELLISQRSTLILFSSHYPAEIAKHCQQILRLDEGRLENIDLKNREKSEPVI